MKFEQLKEKEISKYKQKILNEVKEGKRGSSYSSLRKLGAQPGESKRTGFSITLLIANFFQK